MQGSNRGKWTHRSDGVVHLVDVVNRELTVFVDGERRTFDVPVVCAVLLHGEPVKLRLVQPQDRVKIAFISRDGLRVAQTIEVQPDEIGGHAACELFEVDQPARG